MDAVKYLKEASRMCLSVECSECPLNHEVKNPAFPCKTSSINAERNDPEKCVTIVEKWSAEHPVKTRQSEFLNVFPNAELSTDGILTVAPCLVDKTFNRSAGNIEECCIINDCIKCRREYWLAEVEN